MKRSGFGPRKKPLARGTWSRKSSPLPEQAPRKTAMRQGRKRPTVAEGSKYLAACRGEPCYLRVPTQCRRNPIDETVVPCHENSLASGKGVGLKASHERTVPGCFWCHHWLDQGPATRTEKQIVFNVAYGEWVPVRARKMGIAGIFTEAA